MLEEGKILSFFGRKIKEGADSNHPEKGTHAPGKEVTPHHMLFETLGGNPGVLLHIGTQGGKTGGGRFIYA